VAVLLLAAKKMEFNISELPFVFHFTIYILIGTALLGSIIFIFDDDRERTEKGGMVALFSLGTIVLFVMLA
jgi:hypothetical protein